MKLLAFSLGLLCVSAAHAELVPLSTPWPVDVKTIRVNNASVLPMTGEWEFAITRGEVKAGKFSFAKEEQGKGLDRFFDPGASGIDWKRIPVPANWEMEGFSRPTYNDPDNAVGLYRRWVKVPKSFEGKKVVWHFDGVFAGAEVWVNGIKVGYHESGYGAFDLDVTKAIRPGERNLVAVRVSKLVPSSPLDSGDYWALGGIYRETYMLAVPKLHIADVTIRTDFNGTFKTSQLHADVQVEGIGGEPVDVEVTLYFNGKVPKPVQTFRSHAQSSLIPLSTKVLEPKLWSAEKPNLYTLVLTLRKDDKVIEHVQERFGFRKIEIVNGVLRWNGVPIKATGTCRHEEWSALGHALNEDAWQTDVAMIKAANINAVRTSHYNHAQRFLEICDEKGLYLLDEAAGCWADMKDESLKPWMILHAQEMYARDKNRPSVLAWSIGNESGVGPVNLAAFDWIKKQDPSRPTFISWASKWADPRLDFDDRHYPTYADMLKLAVNDERKTTPLLLSEQPHMYYGSEAKAYDPGFHEAWVISLRNNWDIIWKTPTIFGAYIWEWQDQGLLDKFPGNQDRDPVTKLRQNNKKGFVDGFRKPKGEYYDVKMVYSPIVVDLSPISASGGHFTIPVENRYSFTDLSELTCRWQALAGDKVVGSGIVHPAVGPMSKGQVIVPSAARADQVRLEFIHPDGRSVVAVRVPVAGAPARDLPAPSAVRGAVRVVDGSDAVVLYLGTSQLTIDKASGQLRGLAPNLSGPVLNLGEGQKPGGPLDPKNFLASAQAPILKNPKVTVKGSTVSVVSDVYLAESSDRKATFEYSITPSTDGDWAFHWKLTWQSAEVNAWEVGVKLGLPETVTRLTWNRNAPWSEYPAGHPGAATGSARVSETAFRATKRDVKWMRFDGAPGLSLEAIANGFPLHMRGDHGYLLANSLVEPPKNHNESTPELDIHLKPGQSVEGGFILRVVKGENGHAGTTPDPSR